ncbi:hypothetical protein BKA66DRAFT_596603 [Pyrenochaeta sp. MPI-SDFR-AT-0127]|nr:hypothetical protein BKA66DRAFT_596603 [Pyrenochaeta sp. MPI-SDFR-AT-0127]
MGWLKALRNNTLPLHPEQVQSPHDIKVKLEADVQEISHIEDISISSITPHEISQSLPFASLDTPDSELPFFSAAEIQALASNSGPRNELPEDPLYIVVENIVYDCTQFVHDHPGGRQVIESFRGQDCS